MEMKTAYITPELGRVKLGAVKLAGNGVKIGRLTVKGGWSGPDKLYIHEYAESKLHKSLGGDYGAAREMWREVCGIIGARAENDSDGMTDYFEHDRLIFANDENSAYRAICATGKAGEYHIACGAKGGKPYREARAGVIFEYGGEKFAAGAAVLGGEDWATHVRTGYAAGAIRDLPRGIENVRLLAAGFAGVETLPLESELCTAEEAEPKAAEIPEEGEEKKPELPEGGGAAPETEIAPVSPRPGMFAAAGERFAVGKIELIQSLYRDGKTPLEIARANGWGVEPTVIDYLKKRITDFLPYEQAYLLDVLTECNCHEERRELEQIIIAAGGTFTNSPIFIEDGNICLLDIESANTPGEVIEKRLIESCFNWSISGPRTSHYIIEIDGAPAEFEYMGSEKRFDLHGLPKYYKLERVKPIADEMNAGERRRRPENREGCGVSPQAENAPQDATKPPQGGKINLTFEEFKTAIAGALKEHAKVEPERLMKYYRAAQARKTIGDIKQKAEAELKARYGDDIREIAPSDMTPEAEPAAQNSPKVGDRVLVYCEDYAGNHGVIGTITGATAAYGEMAYYIEFDESVDTSNAYYPHKYGSEFELLPEQETAEKPTAGPAPAYLEIDERAAETAHNMNSFREFRRGHATDEYRAQVDAARELAALQKSKVDAIHYEKIDGLLAAYERKLAGWTNKGFSIESRCPSMLVSGGGNFPTRKKEKQNAARDRHLEEYAEIEGLLDRIRGAGKGGISSDDPDAIEKLQAKAEKLKAERDGYKAHNAKARKEGGEQLPAYLLQNLGAQIRNTELRIYELQRKNATQNGETARKRLEIVIGGKVYDYGETARIDEVLPREKSAYEEYGEQAFLSAELRLYDGEEVTAKVRIGEWIGYGAKTAGYAAKDAAGAIYQAVINSSAKSKIAIRDFINDLKKSERAAQAPAGGEEPANDDAGGWTFDGGKVEKNSGINRLQVFFDDVPPQEVRAALKSNGFKWAPSQKAWQRQLTDNSIRAAKRMPAIAPA
jgi:hypothetical protein